MSMRGLIKLTAIANNIAAREDWIKVSATAIAYGYGDLVIELKPDDDAGWREIDKARHALEARIAEARSGEQQ